MAEVVFAKAFRRHVECPDDAVPGATLRAVLDAYFDRHPVVRGYVLDDVGAVRKHIALFVDGDLITDRTELSDPVGEHDTVHVFQALSGG
ncbi:MAG: MoaD/ThiS family protein [Ilumatobacter sp.]|nr:MoaD/ThiS family protein [Ilumatobacter sp.]